MEVIFNFTLRPSLCRHTFSGVLEQSFGGNRSLLSFYKASLKKDFPRVSLTQSQLFPLWSWLKRKPNVTLHLLPCELDLKTETHLFLKICSLLPNWALCPSHSVTSPHVLESKGVNELGTHKVDTFSQQKWPLCEAQGLRSSPSGRGLWNMVSKSSKVKCSAKLLYLLLHMGLLL